MDVIWILCCNLMSYLGYVNVYIAADIGVKKTPAVCEVPLHNMKISVLELLINKWGTIGLLIE